MKNAHNGRLQVPIFILGVPRSGTTMVARFLRSVTEIGGLTSRLEWAAAQKWFPTSLAGISRHWLEGGQPFNGGFLWDQALKTRDIRFAKRLQKIFFLQQPTMKAWVAKKISNATCIPSLLELFPKSSIFIMHRDPVETVLSLREQRIKKCGNVNLRWGVFVEDAPEQDPDPVIDCALQFLSIYREIERHSDSFNSVITMGYREFCNEPATALRKLEPIIGGVGYPESWSEPIVPRSRSAPADEVAKIRHVLGEALFMRLSGA